MSRTKKYKTRDYQVVMMLAHTKPGSHGHPKRQESKNKCRGKIDLKKEGW